MALYNQNNKVGIGTVDLTEVNEKIDTIYDNGFASTNLLPYPYVGENALSGTKVEGGLTYTDNGDGSVTINGTSTGTSYIRLNVNGGIFGNISGSMISDIGQLEIGEYTAIVSETKDNRLIVAYDPSRDLLAITSNGGGQVFNNEKFYPRVVKNNATDKSYNAYSKSNVDLTAEINRKELELTELKMLGWNVPKGCPIQNTVNGNQFTQRVGRVDLGTLDWTYDRIFKQGTYKCKPADENKKANVYCAKYNTETNIDVFNRSVIGISINDAGNIRVNDPTYTDANTFKTAMNGQYLYYELATPITAQIDGNEQLATMDSVARQKEFLVRETNDVGIKVSFGSSASSRPSAIIAYGYDGMDIIKFSSNTIASGSVTHISGSVVTYDSTTGIIKSATANKQVSLLYPSHFVLTQVQALN